MTACNDTTVPPTPKERTPATAPVAERPVSAAAPPGLEAAVARGVVLPSLDDGTYRVDPFVATLVYERLRVDMAPFVWVEADDPAPAGYRALSVDPADVFAKLGLQAGDIVEALNGRAVRTADQLELALDAAENRLTVTLFRKDLSFTNSYRFEGGLAWRDVIGGGAARAPSEDTELGAPESDVETPDAPVVAARPSSPTTPPRKASVSPRAPKRPGAAPSVPASSDIRCASTSSCTITKRKFDELRASPSTLQRGVGIVPAIQNDVFSGYKLKSVAAGSPVHQLGFRAGDKITHVNGRDLTDDAQAMALYWSLGSSKVFTIRYERGGRRQVRTVSVV